MPKERDNVIAGLFVLSGVILTLVITLALTNLGSFFQQRQTVAVEYTLADGVQGLKEGATVTLGDQPMGSVTGISDVLDEHGSVVAKRITLSMPHRLRLFTNAIIELKAPLVGTGTTVNISSVGSGTPYTAQHVINGSRDSGPLKQVGIQEEQRRQIQRIIANIERLTASLSDAQSQRGNTPIEQVMANLVTISTAVRDDVPALLRKVESSLGEVESILKTAGPAVADIRDVAAKVHTLGTTLTQRSEGWLNAADKTMSSLSQASGEVRDLIHDKGPAMARTVDHLEQTTQSLRDKTLAQVDQAVASVNSAMENIRLSTGELRQLVVGQRPVIERAIANAQLTSDQLKLAAIEVRRSPWRLLYSPSEKELETDNLYDAARSFALAAGTLQSAAQSLRAVNANAQDPAQTKQMLDHLETLFGRYQQAEDAFWKALKGRVPPPSSP